MRPWLLLVAALATAGCTGEPADEPQSTESAELERGLQPMGPGSYAVGDENTVYARTRLSDDGTYEDMTQEGEVVGGGTWTSNDDVICFDPEGDGEDQQERCWRNDPPTSDGSFMSRRVDGDEAYKVTPLDE